MWTKVEDKIIETNASCKSPYFASLLYYGDLVPFPEITYPERQTGKASTNYNFTCVQPSHLFFN